MGARTRQVKFAIPEELANSVEDLAKKCGVDPLDIVCVGLKIVTDIAREYEGAETSAGTCASAQTRKGEPSG